LVDVGVYRCQDGRYVEFPRCITPGLPVQVLPAVYSVATYHDIDITKAVNLSAYIEQGGEVFRNTLALRATAAGKGQVNVSNIELLSWVELSDSTSGRRLAESAALSAPERLLTPSTTSAEIRFVVALTDADTLSAVENEINMTASDPTPFFATYAGEMRYQCKDYHHLDKEKFCIPPASLTVIRPVQTQRYGMDEDKYLPQYIAVKPKATETKEEEDSSLPLEAGLGIGLGVLVCIVCVLLAILVFWLRWQMRKAQLAARKLAKISQDEVKEFGDLAMIGDQEPRAHGGDLMLQDFSDHERPEGQVALRDQALPNVLAIASVAQNFGQELAIAKISPKRSQIRKAIDAKGGWAVFIDDEGHYVTGHGEQTSYDGGIYIGQYKNGVPHGDGRISWPRSDRAYDGQWSDGIPNGQGMLTNRKMDEPCNLEMDECWIYTGQFANGRRHGNGLCEWPNGVWYNGEWQGGVQHGLGEAGRQTSMQEDSQIVDGEKVTAKLLASELRKLREDSLTCSRNSRRQPYPEARIWRFDNGQRQENLAFSDVGPEGDSLIYVLLEQSRKEKELATLDCEGLDDEEAEAFQVRIEQWGVAFGNPGAWLPGLWGALLLTRIFPGGALDRWNQAQKEKYGKEAVTVLPNALIWRINDTEGSAYDMADVISTSYDSRISLYVRNPPKVRYAQLQQNLKKRDGWWKPTNVQDTGWVRDKNQLPEVLIEQHRKLNKDQRESAATRGRAPPSEASSFEGLRQAGLDDSIISGSLHSASPSRPHLIAVEHKHDPQRGLPALLDKGQGRQRRAMPEKKMLAQVVLSTNAASVSQTSPKRRQRGSPSHRSSRPASTGGSQPTSKRRRDPRAAAEATTSPQATRGGLREAGSPLPAGWVAHKDPASGHTYYHKTATNETTWTRPTASSSSNAPAPAAAVFADPFEEEEGRAFLGEQAAPANLFADPFAEQEAAAFPEEVERQG